MGTARGPPERLPIGAWVDAGLPSSAEVRENNNSDFWQPGSQRGKHSDGYGGTKGIRGGRKASTANLLTRDHPREASAKETRREFEARERQMALEFAQLVCEEKQTL